MQTNQTQVKHTPKPWSIGLDSDNEQTQIISEQGEHICYVELSPNEANAQFIVKAVNCHDELVEALKEVQDYMQRNEHFLPETLDRDEIAQTVIEALKKAGE